MQLRRAGGFIRQPAFFIYGVFMNILFYQVLDEPNKINKTLGDAVTKNGALRDSVSILTPELLIQNESIINYNYCFIPELNRYYFIKSVEIVRNNLYKLSLKIDVLMTYKNVINQATAEIIVSEIPNNDFMSCNIGTDFIITEYKLNDVFNHDGVLYLTTATGSTD